MSYSREIYNVFADPLRLRIRPQGVVVAGGGEQERDRHQRQRLTCSHPIYSEYDI